MGQHTKTKPAYSHGWYRQLMLQIYLMLTNLFILFICVLLCKCVYLCASALRGQKKEGFRFPEAEVIGSNCQTWVLGTGLWYAP